jgi:hypothetical protein
MDSLAVSYSTELARWGIETSIIVPGAFTKGTNHFAHSGKPSRCGAGAEYETGPYAGGRRKAGAGRAGRPGTGRRRRRRSGARPSRAVVAPTSASALSASTSTRRGTAPRIVNGVADRVRREMYRNIGLEELLSPAFIG